MDTAAPPTAVAPPDAADDTPVVPPSGTIPNDAVPAARPRTWRARLRGLGPAGVMTACSLLLPPVGVLVLLSQINRLAGPLRDSAWGPAACAVGFTAAGGLALLPTAVLAGFGGWTFGFGVGYPVAVGGFAGAAAVGFAVARRFAKRSVVDRVDADPRWRAVHRALLGGGAARTFWIVALLRAPTVPPFAATTVALAALHVRFWPFLLGTTVGVMPRTAAYVLLAAHAKSLNYDDLAGGWKMFALWGLVTLAVVALLTWIARQALARMTAEPGAAPVGGVGRLTP